MRRVFFRKRGITLVEVLVSTAIFGLLLSMVYLGLGRSMKTFHRVSADTETQQSGMIACEKVFRELNISDSGSVTIITSPYKAMSFMSSRDAEAIGLAPVPDSSLDDAGIDTSPVQWKKFLIFYLDNTDRTIKRKEVPLQSSGGNVKRIKSGLLGGYITDSGYSAKVVAKNIKDLNFSTPRYPGITIDITSTALYVGKEAETRLVFQIMPRN